MTDSRPWRLYSVSPGDFTATRNELAREAREAGNEAEAAEIQSLRKPTVAAWTINRLVREQKESIDELLDQQERIAGASDAQELARATEQRRRALNHLLESARQILEEGGHAASAQTMEKVATTLQATVRPEAREELVAGTLAREIPLSEGAWELALPHKRLNPDRRGQAGGELARAAAEAEANAAELEERADRAVRKAEALKEQARTARLQAERLRARAGDQTD